MQCHCVHVTFLDHNNTLSDKPTHNTLAWYFILTNMFLQLLPHFLCLVWQMRCLFTFFFVATSIVLLGKVESKTKLCRLVFCYLFVWLFAALAIFFTHGAKRGCRESCTWQRRDVGRFQSISLHQKLPIIFVKEYKEKNKRKRKRERERKRKKLSVSLDNKMIEKEKEIKNTKNNNS